MTGYTILAGALIFFGLLALQVLNGKDAKIFPKQVELEKIYTSKVTNFLESEKSKTIEYQKKSWKSARLQINDLLKKIGLVK